ncbi:MAG TPA: hypothetical protein VMX12_00085 [Acidimicrobiia bacterium]|nr:hypothetical protein [Acidimicrobiia bacterium]
MTFFPKIEDPCRPECGLPEGTTIGEAIVQGIAAAAPQETAAPWAGVHPITLWRWIRRGTEEITRMASTGDETPQHTEKPYANLVIGMMTADADAKMRHIAHWSEHLDGDWRAIDKFMSKRWRKEWGDDPTRMELSGPGGGPIPIAAATMSFDEAEAILAEAEAAEARAAVEAGQVALPEAAAG